MCPNVLARTHGIYLLKIEQFHLHTCLGHSNVIFILYVIYRYTCLPFTYECIQYTCTNMRGGKFENKLLFLTVYIIFEKVLE